MQSILFAVLNALLTVKGRFEDQKQNERGATAVEYGLLVALIAAAIIATVGLLGDELNTLFTKVTDALK